MPKDERFETLWDMPVKVDPLPEGVVCELRNEEGQAVRMMEDGTMVRVDVDATVTVCGQVPPKVTIETIHRALAQVQAEHPCDPLDQLVRESLERFTLMPEVRHIEVAPMPRESRYSWLRELAVSRIFRPTLPSVVLKDCDDGKRGESPMGAKPSTENQAPVASGGSDESGE
jgi:hypothetical protein